MNIMSIAIYLKMNRHLLDWKSTVVGPDRPARGFDPGKKLIVRKSRRLGDKIDTDKAAANVDGGGHRSRGFGYRWISQN